MAIVDSARARLIVERSSLVMEPQIITAYVDMPDIGLDHAGLRGGRSRLDPGRANATSG